MVLPHTRPMRSERHFCPSNEVRTKKTYCTLKKHEFSKCLQFCIGFCIGFHDEFEFQHFLKTQIRTKFEGLKNCIHMFLARGHPTSAPAFFSPAFFFWVRFFHKSRQGLRGLFFRGLFILVQRVIVFFFKSAKIQFFLNILEKSLNIL